MVKAISEYSRTSAQEEIEEEENCIVATIQFRKLSKRQRWILEKLRDYGCLDFSTICDWCVYLEARPNAPEGPFGAESVEQKRKRLLIHIESYDHISVSESYKQSVYRSMRELEERDLVARLEHHKPAVWTWIKWRDKERAQLGITHETGAFNSDSKLWGRDTWKSKHHRFGKSVPLSTKELKRNVKYHDKLWSHTFSKSIAFKREAEKRGLMKDDKWIDE